MTKTAVRVRFSRTGKMHSRCTTALAMDQHFRTAALDAHMPVIMGRGSWASASPIAYCRRLPHRMQ
jgi:hypothetical protein